MSSLSGEESIELMTSIAQFHEFGAGGTRTVLRSHAELTQARRLRWSTNYA